MLLYTRRAPPKPPKRRSRAGCVHCKEKKKKCTEERPSCQRCVERGLECHYEPIQPRKRRRTVSPSDPSRPVVHSGSTSPNIEYDSRVRSLRNGSNAASPMPTAAVSSSPSLNIAGSWDMQSSYDDSASQYTSEFQSESSVSPDIVEGFPRPSFRHSSVPGDHHDQRPRSHLSTPDMMQEPFRRPSHSGTPDMMSVPCQGSSDTGATEVITSIPIMPSHHMNATGLVSSAPIGISGSFDRTQQAMLHPSHSPYLQPNSPGAQGHMGSIPTIQPPHLETPGYLGSPPVSSAAFYQSADAFAQPPNNSMAFTSGAFYQPTSAFVTPPHTSQQNMNNMAWWPQMDQMNQNYYTGEHQ